jgi:site-specific recombinase XerD/ribosomal protein L40E
MLADEGLTPKMREELDGFLAEYAENKKLAIPTRSCYIRPLMMFGRILKAAGMRSYKEAKKPQIIAFFRELNGKSESTSDWSKIAIKVFYRWILTGGTRKKDAYPPIVEWIEITGKEETPITTGDLITPQEFEKMLACTQHPRDRALLWLLWETGCRRGELMNVKIGDLDFQSNSTEITFRISKTEPHSTYLRHSLPDLQAWLNQHPRRNDAQAYLFVHLKAWSRHDKQGKLVYNYKVGDAISYGDAYKIVKTALARTGITGKKRIMHIFRHTSISRDTLNPNFSARLLETKHGLCTNSRRLSVYQHLKKSDLLKALQRSWGELEVKVEETGEKVRVCMRCKQSNPFTASYCTRCGFALTPEAITKSVSVADLMARMESLEARAAMEK